MLTSVLIAVLAAGLVVAVIALLVVARRQLALGRVATEHLDAIAQRVSERLVFRRPELADLDFYVAMATDPHAAEANGWTGAESGMVRRRFGNRKLFAQLRSSEIVAIDREANVPVATATFASSVLDPVNARSVGIHVQADYRKRGYGREVMAVAILLLQSTPGAIHVGTRVTNVGMQRIMQQLGFEPEPGTRPYRAPNGVSYDAYWYHCGSDTHPPAGARDV